LTTGNEENVAKLKLALEVYSAARRYDLAGLKLFARYKIDALSKLLGACTIVDVVSEVYPSLPVDDAWFTQHIKLTVTKAFSNVPAKVRAEGHAPSMGSEPREMESTAATILRFATETHQKVVCGLAGLKVIPEQSQNTKVESPLKGKAVLGIQEPINPREPDACPHNFTVAPATCSSPGVPSTLNIPHVAPYTEKEPNNSAWSSSYQGISFSVGYQGWSPEELRLNDYETSTRSFPSCL
jgi:hypothetical protein